MTREQKQLLRAVPAAALMVAGLFAMQYAGMREFAETRVAEQVPPSDPGSGSHHVDDALGRLQTSVNLRLLAAIEQQIGKDEEFVRSAEAFDSALRVAPHAEVRKSLDGEVEKAVAAITRRQSSLKEIQADTLPEGDRVRVVAAAAKCQSLGERLARCRHRNVSTEPKDK